MEDESHECCQACLVNICERGRVLNVNWTENSNIIRTRYIIKEKSTEVFNVLKIIQCAQRHKVFEININYLKCHHRNILELYNIINAQVFT